MGLNSISEVGRYAHYCVARLQCYGVVRRVRWMRLEISTGPVLHTTTSLVDGKSKKDQVVLRLTLMASPCLVVNLWDVTDKDIDKFAQSVFNRLKLEPETVKARKQGKNVGSGVSVVRAVAESRDVCKLKYLTGAAPIVYGIPFYL